MYRALRRHLALIAHAALERADVVEAATAAAARHDELVASRLDRLAAEGALGCSSGCSHCCRLGVNASLPELASLARHVRERFGAEELSALRLRLEGPADGRPCALLVEGRCSAYEARPLACRGWSSADPEPCRLAALQPEARVEVPVHRSVRDTAIAMAEGLRDAVVAFGADSSQLDLRRGLRGVLAQEEAELLADWLAGQRLPLEWRDEDETTARPDELSACPVRA